ncbi:MAG: hypothetical protein JNM80_10395 [Phycisphaerae bacterium]|nr:hypothetical protein [Phycisphaerae bacterium]
MSEETSTTLNPAQEQCIVALLNEPNIRRVAEVIGVNEKTVHRWLDDPVFNAAYRKARREAFKQAVGMVQKYTPVAVQTLASIAVDKSAPHSSRVSASTALLKFSRDSIELDDLAARVETLEQAAKTTQHSGFGAIP